MKRQELLNKIQGGAVQAIMENGGNGTVKAVMGFGKSFVFFKWLYALLDSGKIIKGDSIFFFAETIVREKNMKNEGEKYYKIFGKHPYKDFNIEHRVNDSSGDRVCDAYDEIDTRLARLNHVSIKNSPAKYKTGYTGTVDKTTTVFRDEVPDQLHGRIFQSDEATKDGKITQFVNKGQLLDILCPVVFEYTLEQGIEDGLISPFQTTIIDHKMDTRNKNIRIWKSYPTLGSEYDYYSRRDNIRKDFSKPKYLKGKMAREMVNLVQNLPSKIPVVKRLLSSIEGKSVVFATELDFLGRITPNVVRDHHKVELQRGTEFVSFEDLKEAKKFLDISSRKRISIGDVYNGWTVVNYKAITAEDYIDLFDADKIDVLGSAKKIGRGVTLNNVKNCILASYNSKSANMMQQLGRVLRWKKDKIANLYIIRTLDTFESDRWFGQINKIYNERGNIEEEIDLNIVKTIRSDEI